MKKLAITLAVLLVMSVASVASADYNVYLRETGVSPANQISIDGTLYTGSGVLAGNYLFDIGNNYPQYLPTSWTSYSGFCVDPGNSNAGWSEYNVTGITDRYQAAAYVLANYSGTAAQIAVWELVWDWTSGTNWGADLTSGGFALSGDTANPWYAAANTILNDALLKAAGFDSSAFLLAVSPAAGGTFGVDYQDYIFRAQTPIPAAVWLLGSALLGLVGIRRRMSR